MRRSYKQVLSIIAAITLLSGGIPQNSPLPLRPALTVSAADISLDDFKYELTSDEEGVIITQYTGSDTAVVVPDEINDMPVTEIGSWAFFDKNDIISINLPDTVTSIGNNAFNLLINLQEINMPAELTTIGSGAFCQTGLTEVKLPDKVTSIGSYAFSSCASLETIEIPESVDSIGESAFRGTKWLNKQQESSPLVVVNGILIDGTTCTGSVTVPDTVNSIADMAFNSSGINKIVLKDSVKSIGDSAFCYCSSLSDVTLSNNLTSIGPSAFKNCSSLKEIEIPDSVTSLGGSAFFLCANLTSVKLSANLEVIDNSTFMGCQKLPEIKLPEKIKNISVRAFAACSSLSEITVPDGVESIEFGAFQMCSNLRTVRIPESVKSIDPNAFLSCEKFRLVGVAGSYAESYAHENFIPFCINGCEDETQFSGVSLTLQDDLGLNFYMDGISASSDAAKYSVTFSGKCDENGKTVQLTKKNGKFCATANVSADHMDELIVATLKKDGKVIGSYSYKVKEYLDSVSTYGNDELAALVNTVKTYGSVSKAYFNTPDSMPAVSDYSEKYSTAEFEPKKDSSDMISLVLDSKLAARLYVDGLTATGTAVCGSDTLKAKKSASGEYYFEVKGIDPTELADDIVIKYNEKEYVFKPLSWCYLVSKNNAGGRNQVMADMLYEYYTNAAAYKNTL